MGQGLHADPGQRTRPDRLERGGRAADSRLRPARRRLLLPLRAAVGDPPQGGADGRGEDARAGRPPRLERLHDLARARGCTRRLRTRLARRERDTSRLSSHPPPRFIDDTPTPVRAGAMSDADARHVAWISALFIVEVVALTLLQAPNELFYRFAFGDSGANLTIQDLIR